MGSRASSKYASSFKTGNHKANRSPSSHFIELEEFGIERNDYEAFLKVGSTRIFDEFNAIIDPSHEESVIDEIYELITAGGC